MRHIRITKEGILQLKKLGEKLTENAETIIEATNELRGCYNG
jgi:hypothetical protein